MILNPNGEEVQTAPKFKLTNKVKAICITNKDLAENRAFLTLYDIIIGYLELINAKEEETEKGFKYSYDGIYFLEVDVSAITGHFDVRFTCMNEIRELYNADIKAKNYTYMLPLAMGYYYMLRQPINDVVFSYPSMITGFLVWKTGKSVEEILNKKKEICNG